MSSAPAASPTHVLGYPEFRAMLLAAVTSTLAGRAVALTVAYQLYELTKDPLTLGVLGLVEAIPALSLALLGGVVADRVDRRRILLFTFTAEVVCAGLFALYAPHAVQSGIWPLLGLIFALGVARGFSDPALPAFQAQLVPRELLLRASAWRSSVWQAAAIIGPALGGVLYASVGPQGAYGVACALFAVSLACLARVRSKGRPAFTPGEPLGQSIKAGLAFVLQRQVLVGSMALDLFSVLFGGAIALLPVFASDILKVGPTGLGVLVAAPSVGALAVMLLATHRPPGRGAGRTLLLAVAGFGLSMIVFGLSQNLVLSVAALVAAGVFDGISMVIRSATLQLKTPDHMRGRVNAVSGMFIGASNELGAFESGVAARLLGTARSVWLGGIVTLIVVAVTAALAPELRAMNLEDEAED
ncbi:MFS transporter [Deinococcus multiflagellatus]|uniref:MFS transporter n=1 Tax=Deinococcus multiflagellatus TaxID=1656887 RepID=A0ABW1ZKJ6_9DEIO|nr:MFS transporter [Deinococcus multiflagellatus]MBZ9712428.1 MFS transporter [Deinococcus multiflagellatus]